MPSIHSTLRCQVDGLIKVYIYDKNVYFAFENEEQLNKAKEKVIQLWDSNDCPFFMQKKPAEQRTPLDLLYSYPKEARFSFGISTKPEEETSVIGSTEKLIKRVASLIESKSPIKEVLIKKIHNSEELKYKTIF